MTSTATVQLARVMGTVQRRDLFTSLMMVAVANSFIHTASRSIGDLGALGALANGLSMSWAFWIAWVLTARLALTSPGAVASRWDLAVGAVCLALILAPVQALSAVSATLLGGWFFATSGASPRLRSAALILLAIAFSVFWSQVAVMLFSRPVAAFDGLWINMLSGAAIDGSYVRFIEGEKGFLLFPGCTSVSNASLAVLIWLATVRTFRPEGLKHEWLVGLGVFVTVVLINGARLGLMAQSREAFDYWHGGPGSGVFTALVTLAGLAWAAVGVRREILR